MKKYLVIFNIFNILDCVTTIYGIKYKGLHEINPIMKIALHFGIQWFVISKLLVGAYITWQIIRDGRLRTAKLLAGLFIAVVLWNLIHIVYSK